MIVVDDNLLSSLLSLTDVVTYFICEDRQGSCSPWQDYLSPWQVFLSGVTTMVIAINVKRWFHVEIIIRDSKTFQMQHASATRLNSRCEVQLKSMKNPNEILCYKLKLFYSFSQYFLSSSRLLCPSCRDQGIHSQALGEICAQPTLFANYPLINVAYKTSLTY